MTVAGAQGPGGELGEVGVRTPGRARHKEAGVLAVKGEREGLASLRRACGEGVLDVAAKGKDVARVEPGSAGGNGKRAVTEHARAQGHEAPDVGAVGVALCINAAIGHHLRREGTREPLCRRAQAARNRGALRLQDVKGTQRVQQHLDVVHR